MEKLFLPLALCVFVAVPCNHGVAQWGEAPASKMSPLGASVTPTTLDFTGLTVSPSQWKVLTYYYSGPGQGYMVITSSEHAQVSLQGNSFSNSISFSIAPPIMPPVTIYVRVISTDTMTLHEYVWCTANSAGIPYLGVPPAVFLDTVRITGSFITAGISPGPGAPVRFKLEQNYPNPFNPSTTINYALPRRLHVTLTVYNDLSQQVATLVNETEDAGYHDVQFDGNGLASGVYFYRIVAGEQVATKKFVILR